MISTHVLAVGPQGPTTELTGTAEYFRWYLN